MDTSKEQWKLATGNMALIQVIKYYSNCLVSSKCGIIDHENELLTDFMHS